MGEACSHGDWTSELDRGVVLPAKPAQAGGAARVTRQAARRSGPSPQLRQSIKNGSLLCLPGDEDDETADGEDVWFANALGPAEQNEYTFDCGPSRLIKNHYSVPVEWLNLDELTDEYAIFSVWPTEQNRLATTHLMAMPDLAWEKRERADGCTCRARSMMHVMSSCEDRACRTGRTGTLTNRRSQFWLPI